MKRTKQVPKRDVLRFAHRVLDLLEHREQPERKPPANEPRVLRVIDQRRTA
jgi:hypothetical protein